MENTIKTKLVDGYTISSENPKNGDDVLVCFEHDKPWVMKNIKLFTKDENMYAVSANDINDKNLVKAYSYFDNTWGIFKIIYPIKKFVPHEGEGVDHRFDDENITFGNE